MTSVYVAFENGKPVASDNGNDVIGDVRNNEQALRDSVIWQNFSGWPVSLSGGSGGAYTTILYSNGTERVRKTVTYGTSGGATDNPIKVVHEYSSDSGVDYKPRTPFKTLNISFNADGDPTGTTWDNS